MTRPSVRRTPSLVLALASACTLLAGCKSAGDRPAKAPAAAPVPTPNTAPPTFDFLAQRYNRGVEPLDKFRATQVVLRLEYTDDQGQQQIEQLEGSLRYRRPQDVSLHLHKAGAKDVAILGSNSELYWWLELAEGPRALVGEHARFQPDRVDDFAMPVHPLDFLDLLALTPIDAQQLAQGRLAGFDPDTGASVIQVPGRASDRLIWFKPTAGNDPATSTPVGVAIVDRAGQVRATSTLAEPAPVDIPGLAEADEPRVASRVTISFPTGQAKAGLWLSDLTAAAWSSRGDSAFNLERLIERYRISDVASVDEPASQTQAHDQSPR